ncbi:MAG: hypothetical protein ABW043_12295 [Devosia sp.]|uniref:hypothetical protein n=1 Tax=Devosia sp. TaxID=1871048 RepID=UPI00339600CE
MDQVQAFQIAWFTVEPPTAALDAYRKIFGADPDGYQTHRGFGGPVPYLSTANGRFNDLTVQVGVQPGRIELLFQPDDPTPGPDEAWPILDRKKVFAAASSIAAKAEFSGVVRQAVIANLWQPEETLESASAHALKLSGLQLNYDDALDVMFQINRRLKSVNGDALLNRLLRVGVGHMQQMMIPTAPSGAPITVSRFGVSIVVDVNNVPTSEPYATDEQRRLLLELLAEADRLAIAGHVDALK